jgi:hypothetical protein
MRVPVVTSLLCATAILALGVAIGAQPRQRASPHEKTQATVDGASISIEYGRPYVKGREIFGGLVPYGQVWRTGADEATTLVTDATLVFGGLTVPAGTYTLYTLPGTKDWSLIVNKKTGQWGTQYSQADDLGRVPMHVSKLDAPVEQLTIDVADTAAGGELQIQWATTRVVAPFTVKK